MEGNTFACPLAISRPVPEQRLLAQRQAEVEAEPVLEVLELDRFAGGDEVLAHVRREAGAAEDDDPLDRPGGDVVDRGRDLLLGAAAGDPARRHHWLSVYASFSHTYNRRSGPGSSNQISSSPLTVLTIVSTNSR